MWSFQSPDGRMSVSAIHHGPAGEEVALGFVDLDGRLASVASIESAARYDDHGVQHDVELLVVDELGREIRATLGSMHSHLGSGAPERLWGFEGVGTYDVEGFGALPGLISYFWPPTESPASLTGRR